MRVQRFTKSLMASLVLAISVSAPAVAQMDDKQAMMDLVIQVQQLQDEVRMLRGMLEDQAIQLENLSNRQRDQYLDLDQRITGSRGASTGPSCQAARNTSGARRPRRAQTGDSRRCARSATRAGYTILGDRYRDTGYPGT